MTSLATKIGTSFGPELLIELRGSRRRAQLEDRLRALVRDGTVSAGSRLPSSRSLASDLEVSRRLVVDAYAQLLAEGYLVARRGGGTYVAAAASTAGQAPRRAPARPLQFDFFPGAPDLASFPRALWSRALRDVLRSAPASAFAYPDVRGAHELRVQLSAYLRRVRGVVTEPDSIVICAGATQGLALLGRALAREGVRAIAVEDPCLPPHRAVLAYAGLEVRGVAVDEHGLDVGALDAPAVLATPAHQCPSGVVLSPQRRGELVQWARAGGLVIEDDYDAEFRYDRAPLGALQGLASEHVVYLGTTSKTLAPGLRLGWLAVPGSLLGAVIEAKALDDLGSATIEQLALARLLETAAYDRHLRKVRRRNRARRDALILAVARELLGARVSGISAGLHALVRLAQAVDADRLLALAAERSVRVYPLSQHLIDPPPETDALVLGYGNLAEPAIEEGIRRLAAALGQIETGDAP
ncbi:MAG TPA: PLP-dependent aminotransferase family protein [Solirubrobacteraceae bacterium]|nr:PLP-dependent aminotransferase family protein [Solirubrobacteraceae bacterium]